EGIRTGAVALARATLKAAFPRYAIAVLVLLGVGTLSAGILLSSKSDPFDGLAPARPEAGEREAFSLKLVGGPAVDEDVPIRVSGRVLQPDGKPCPNASLYVGHALRGLERSEPPPKTAWPLRATTGADGHFQF